MEVIVALWQEEMKNLCRNRENKDTISTAPSPWDLSGVSFCWEDIKSPEKCADVEPFPTEKTSKSTHFFLKSLVKINQWALFIDCFFLHCLNVSILKYVQLKHSSVAYSAYFALCRKKGATFLPQPKKFTLNQTFLHAGKQQMEIKLYHFFDDTVNLEGVFIVK